jgi:uncharacterized protein (TIGR02421 family)
MSMDATQYFIEFDKQLVAASKSIKILSVLGWSERIADDFIAGWKKGNPRPPVISYPKFDYTDEKAILSGIMNKSDRDHPVGWYIGQTAHSYFIAAQMLEGLGTAAFRECSEALYGRPDDHIGKLSNLDLADDFIDITGDFSAILDLSDTTGLLGSLEAAAKIKAKSDEFFKDYSITVLVENDLSSKAAAGSERVRIRGKSEFTANETEQLIQHEVFVHSATMLNGRRQPWLKSMGLGSPRTTATQEGLATFAELITGTMDLGRLRRIALRIKGIHHALNGADFLETFRFFINAGQPDRESFQSAARIFRGGDMNGVNIFTKDCVYLKGLLSVHTFLRKAIQERKIDYPQRLFSGRMTIGDVVRLDTAFEDGWIVPGKYIAPWAANQQGLAAYLCYNAFSNRLQLEEIRLDDFSFEMKDLAAVD